MSTKADPVNLLYSGGNEAENTCKCVHTHGETAWYMDKHAPIYASDVLAPLHSCTMYIVTVYHTLNSCIVKLESVIIDLRTFE